MVGFGASQGGNLPRPQDHGPLHMLSLFVFSYMIDTNKRPFQPNDFGRTSSRPLRLASFITEHCELVLLHIELDHCDGFVYFHGRGQGLAAEWVDASVPGAQGTWTQTMRCCRNPKPTTWWKDVSGCAGNSAPLVPESPQLWYTFHHIYTVYK